MDEQEFSKRADELGFGLTEAQKKILYGRFLDLVEGFEIFDQLRISNPKPIVADAMRVNYGCPVTEDDPLNHFITRTSVYVPGARGPLSGIQIALKDNIAVAGIPLTLGYRMMEGFIPDYDATVVIRLLEAGAEIIGKTNMDSNSFGGSGWGGTGDFGPPKNPVDNRFLTGGSSSGSAGSVGSGTVQIAFGGDQAGSTRLPASWCGIVGLKATHGLIPQTGVVGLDPTIDSTGPMAKTVEEIAMVLDVVAGPDGYDFRQIGLPSALPKFGEELNKGSDNLRVGVLVEGHGQNLCSDDVESNFLDVISLLKSIVSVVDDVSVPLHPYGALAEAPILSQGARMVIDTHLGLAFNNTFYPESLMATYGRIIQTNAHELSPNIQLHMLAGAYVNERYQGRLYAKAQNVKREFNRQYDKIFAEYDVIVMPTCGFAPVAWTDFKSYLDAYEYTLFGGAQAIDLVRLTVNTAPFSYTGHPAISVPCGVASNGLPLGLQIVGPRYRDDLVLRLALQFQQVVEGKA